MNTAISAGLKFFLRFFIAYSVLTGISLIPQVGSFFNNLYRQPTQKGLQLFFPKAHIQLAPDKKDHGIIRVEYASKEKVEEYQRLNRQGANKGTVYLPGKLYEFKFYNLFLGFFVFFVALMIFSPLPRKELAISLVIGTILFYLYTFFKAALTLFVLFNKANIAIYQSSPNLLRFMKALLYPQTLGLSVLIVLLIWAALVFRKGNWKALLQK